MACPSKCVLGENLTFTVQSYDGTGAPVAATGAVSYSVYEDETSAAILTGSMAQLASQTGFYSEQIACTSANGFEQFKTYTIRITATISGISSAKVYSFLCVGVEDTTTYSTGALTTTARFKSYAGIETSDDDTLIGLLINRATASIQNYCHREFISDTYRERYYSTGDEVLCLKNYPVTNVQYVAVGTYDALRIKNTSSDAYHARVSVTLDSTDKSQCSTMTLSIDGGTNDGSDDLTLTSYTLATLDDAIIALGKGWTAEATPSVYNLWDAEELLAVSGLACLNQDVYIKIPEELETDYEVYENVGQVYLPSKFTPYSIEQNRRPYNQKRKPVIVKYTGGYATIPADLEQVCIDVVNNMYRSRTKDLSIKAERLGDHSITFASENAGIDLSNGIKMRLAPYKRFII